MEPIAPPRTSYPSDVDDEVWTFVVPYPMLMDEAAPQRRYPLRELFNGWRWIVLAGASGYPACAVRGVPNRRCSLSYEVDHRG